ncbi:MAG: hypothetical protein EOP11_18765 [Proteobacteria bacterium]|nr:MAG: hypothetical protein EOP11_18765 [Pseudomonadota bacterium]
MKAFLLAALFCFALSATAAFAAPKINKHDWEVGGGFNFSHLSREENLPSKAQNNFSLRGIGQYFLADELSAGAEISVNASGGNTYVQAGPIITKYIFVDDKLAPYLSMLPIVVKTASNVPAGYRSTVRAGAKYFLNDSVAVGPALEYSHDWESGPYRSQENFSFLGLFSIHL